MSAHIEAEPGEVADKILLLGGPLRAKYIAETFLENPICHNQVHGVLGYTGAYKGRRASVQKAGMGMPSAGIYTHELINSYDVRRLIRAGTCSSVSEKVNVRELVIVQTAATPSSAIRNDFPKYDSPQIVSFGLLLKPHEIAKAKNFTTHVGSVLSDDVFYKDSLDDVFRLGRYGVLVIEMEAAILYYLAVKFDVEALVVIAVSDSSVTGEETTAKER